MNSLIYSRDRQGLHSLPVSPLSHRPFLTFFIHLLLVSVFFLFRSERASSPQFSALLKGAICSPAQWRHTTRGSRLKPGDWNQKNTEWGFFSPSGLQIWQLLFRFHTAATTEAPQPMCLPLNSMNPQGFSSAQC